MNAIPYIPLDKLAEQMGVSIKTVRRWTKAGLRTARIGKTAVTRTEWLEEFAREDVEPVKPRASRFLKKYAKQSSGVEQ